MRKAGFVLFGLWVVAVEVCLLWEGFAWLRVAVLVAGLLVVALAMRLD